MPAAMINEYDERVTPRSIWSMVRSRAEPEILVKFSLIYDGDLPSAGNKPQPKAASRMRNEFHEQLADLWERHVILRQLRHEARVFNQRMGDLTLEISAPTLPDYRGAPPPLRPNQIDLCAPIPVPSAGVNFLPLVRNSLYLACAVDILFLRHEEPMSLMRQGGDLDGRLKTLFDALKMPDPKNPYKGLAPAADPLCVVLEDDALISDLSVKTGRLLGPNTKDFQHAVHLTVDITVKVLRVFPQNLCLVGG
jgi:hypothetical protein